MKKGTLAALALVLLATGLITVSPSAARTRPPAHKAHKHPAYKHYVACGLSRKAKPAHVCSVRGKKGAFFKSLRADVIYKVCVSFPTHEHLCTHKLQEAERGRLYVNEIISTMRGRHRITWFVKGKKVGTTVLRLK